MNLVLLLSLLVIVPKTAMANIRMHFSDRPNFQDRHCKSQKVRKRSLVQLHYNASIDASSPVGTPGMEVENTRKRSAGHDGSPIEIIVGVGQTGWDHALVYLCVGDKANLVIEGTDAPYGIERYRDNVPRGATVRVTLEIVKAEASLEMKLRDHDSFLLSSADKDQDKRLSQREFLYYFKDKKAKLGSAQYKQTLKDLSALFVQLDRNHDKFLTLDEFTFRKTSVHPSTALTPRDEFNFYDDNRDGKLNKKEVEGFFKSIKRKVPMDYWKHMDRNRNGYISFEEFTKGAYSDYKDEL